MKALPAHVVLELCPSPSQDYEEDVRSLTVQHAECTGAERGRSPSPSASPETDGKALDDDLAVDASAKDMWSPEDIVITASVACRIPYVVSALSAEWQGSAHLGAGVKVRVFMPTGCSPCVLRALLAWLAIDADVAEEQGLDIRWKTTDLVGALQLLQVASMLQIEDVIPQLVSLVRETVITPADFAVLDAACRRMELPAALREAAASIRPGAPEPYGLPDQEQVRGMIASALLTADGKVWRVVQKVIDRREAWPRLARENAAVLLAFATGVHGSIRATPHTGLTGFFWGSRDLLFLICRYIRSRPMHFDAMVSAMFDSVYSMDPELPHEIIDAVFKELLVHDGLTFTQCEHVIAKLIQREDQLEYLFHEWSGVFPTLPGNARRALAKGLLPTVGRCPHTALDFVLKELDSVPSPGGTGRVSRLPSLMLAYLLGGDGDQKRFPLMLLLIVSGMMSAMCWIPMQTGSSLVDRTDLAWLMTGQALFLGLIILAVAAHR